MRLVAFDSKNFNRTQKLIDGKEFSFFTPLGVGVAFDDPEGFAKAYIEATEKISKEFGIGAASCIYSSSLLKDDLEDMSKALAFAQQLIDATSKFVSHIHFSYVVLPPKVTEDVIVGGERCPTYSVKVEEFLRNLSPMFSYISAWNYKRNRNDEECKLLIDAFSSKETIAWRELVKMCDISVISRGDEVDPFISYADIIAFLTDAKLYGQKMKLSVQNLEKVWKGAFDVKHRYIDIKSLNKIKWVNETHIDFRRYMRKPTVFFIADDPDRTGVNEEFVKPSEVEKKSKRLMKLQPVKNAINYATSNNCSFRFYDPYMDEKYVSDDDIIVYMGERSKKIADYLNDAFNIKIFKAREIGKKL